jgi:hypothetical protein
MQVERIAARVVSILAFRVAKLESALEEIATGDVSDTREFAGRILMESRQRARPGKRCNTHKWPDES